MKIERKIIEMHNQMLADMIAEAKKNIVRPNWDLLDLIVKHGNVVQDINRKPGVVIKNTTWPLWYGEIKGIKGEDLGWYGDDMYLDLFKGKKGTASGVSGLCMRKKDVKLLVGFGPKDWKNFEKWLPKYWKDARVIMR